MVGNELRDPVRIQVVTVDYRRSLVELDGVGENHSFG